MVKEGNEGQEGSGGVASWIGDEGRIFDVVSIDFREAVDGILDKVFVEGQVIGLLIDVRIFDS